MQPSRTVLLLFPRRGTFSDGAPKGQGAQARNAPGPVHGAVKCHGAADPPQPPFPTAQPATVDAPQTSSRKGPRNHSAELQLTGTPPYTPACASVVCHHGKCHATKCTAMGSRHRQQLHPRGAPLLGIPRAQTGLDNAVKAEM